MKISKMLCKKNPKMLRKKIVVGVVALAMVAMFGLVACSGGDNAQKDQNQQDATQSQQEQNKDNSDAVTGMDESDESQNQDSTNGSATGGNAIEEDVNAEGFKLHLDELEARVDQEVNKIDAVSVPDDPADRPAAFFQALAPLENLQADLDEVQGQLENSFNKGTISQDEFWELQERWGQLEDKLIDAADNLEDRMSADN